MAQVKDRQEDSFHVAGRQRPFAAGGWFGAGLLVAEGFAIGEQAGEHVHGQVDAGETREQALVRIFDVVGDVVGASQWARGVGLGGKRVQVCLMIDGSHGQLLRSWLWSAGRMGCNPSGPRCTAAGPWSPRRADDATKLIKRKGDVCQVRLMDMWC